MPTLRVLTVDLSDLNLETDVIDGARVEISIERAASFDSFVIVPSLDYKATSDNTGILTFNILPSDSNTRYRASVTDATGHQVLTGIFVMPDSDANIADLLDLSFFPDGMNVPDKNIGFLDYQLNGVSIGSPMLLKTINIVSDGLASFDAGTGVLTINLHPKSGESLILRGSGAPASGLGSNGDLYYDSVGKAFYEKSGGSWSKSGSLVPADPLSEWVTLYDFPPTLSLVDGKVVADVNYALTTGYESGDMIEVAAKAGARSITVKFNNDNWAGPVASTTNFTLYAELYSGSSVVGTCGFIIEKFHDTLMDTGVVDSDATNFAWISAQRNGDMLDTSLTYTLAFDPTTRAWSVTCSDSTVTDGAALLGQIPAGVTGSKFALSFSGAAGAVYNHLGITILSKA